MDPRQFKTDKDLKLAIKQLREELYRRQGFRRLVRIKRIASELTAPEKAALIEAGRIHGTTKTNPETCPSLLKKKLIFDNGHTTVLGQLVAYVLKKETDNQ